MLDRGFRHLPVMEGAALVGVVSLRDLSRSQ
jgi:CBS domain-containing protein